MYNSKINISNINQPILFICTFAKDAEKYINKLFNSLIKQKKKNFVHYIYDDGSINSLENIVNKYKEKVSKLKNSYQIMFERNSTNIGINASTAHCISKSVCPYFIWINADDWVSDNYTLEVEKSIMKHKNSDIFATNIEYVNNDNITKYPFKYFKTNNLLDPMYMYILRSEWIGTYYIVKTKSYLKANPQNTLIESYNFHNDMQLCMMAFVHKWKWTFVKKATAYYYVRSDSAFHVNGCATLKEQIKIIKKERGEDFPCKNIKDLFDLKKKILEFDYVFIQKNYDKTKRLSDDIKNYFKTITISKKIIYNKNTKSKMIIIKSKILYKLWCLVYKIIRLIKI